MSAPSLVPPNRRNALFYKTLNGAAVGDLFMNLIHTCELNRENPFDYLTNVLRHAKELRQKPSEWLSWNYRDTLPRIAAQYDGPACLTEKDPLRPSETDISKCL